MYNLQLNKRILKFSRQKLALESTAKIVAIFGAKIQTVIFMNILTNSVNVNICLSREQFEDRWENYCFFNMFDLLEILNGSKSLKIVVVLVTLFTWQMVS